MVQLSMGSSYRKLGCPRLQAQVLSVHLQPLEQPAEVQDLLLHGGALLRLPAAVEEAVRLLHGELRPGHRPQDGHHRDLLRWGVGQQLLRELFRLWAQIPLMKKTIAV